MATKKKIAAKTQPKRRAKKPTVDERILGLSVEMTRMGNRISQLNADMHAEVGSIKSGNGKTDRLMAQNAQEFQELRGLVKRLVDHRDGTQSVLNHVDTRLRVLEQAAKDDSNPVPPGESSTEISLEAAVLGIAKFGFERWLGIIGFKVIP